MGLRVVVVVVVVGIFFRSSSFILTVCYFFSFLFFGGAEPGFGFCFQQSRFSYFGFKIQAGLSCLKAPQGACSIIFKFHPLQAPGCQVKRFPDDVSQICFTKASLFHPAAHSGPTVFERRFFGTVSF